MVERKLPVIANKADADHKIVQMNIISQDKLETIPHLTSVLNVECEPSCKIVQVNIISQDEMKSSTSRIITPEIGQGEMLIADNMSNAVSVTCYKHPSRAGRARPIRVPYKSPNNKVRHIQK